MPPRSRLPQGKHAAYDVPFHVSPTQRKGILASMTDDVNFLKNTCKTARAAARRSRARAARCNPLASSSAFVSSASSSALCAFCRRRA